MSSDLRIPDGAQPSSPGTSGQPSREFPSPLLLAITGVGVVAVSAILAAGLQLVQMAETGFEKAMFVTAGVVFGIPAWLIADALGEVFWSELEVWRWWRQARSGIRIIVGVMVGVAILALTVAVSAAVKRTFG